MQVAYIFLLSSFLSSNQKQELDISLSSDNLKRKDGVNISFTISLVNVSSEPQFILDQVFDNVHAERSSFIDNLVFVTQKLANDKYAGYRDVPFQDGLSADFRAPNELLDSISKLRDPYIKLMPKDTLLLSYPFMSGRQFSKGYYRTRVQFKYDFKGIGKIVESKWFYFHVANDLIRSSPEISVNAGKEIFWKKK